MKNRIRILGLLFAAVTAISLIPLYLFTAKAEGTPEHTAPITEKPVYVTVTDEAGASVSGANVQVLDPDGKPKMKRYLPIGITVDERVCSGAHYSKLFADMLAGIKDPSILEKEPEQVSYEYGVEYHVPKPQPKA